MDYLKLLGLNQPRGGGAPSVLDEKKVAIAAKAEEKKQKLAPVSGIDQAIKASLMRSEAAQADAAGGYEELMATKRQMQIDATDSFEGDLIRDVPLGIAAGTASVGSSLAGLALRGLGKLGELDNPDGLAPELLKDAGTAVLKAGDSASNFLRSKQTTRAELGRARTAQRNQEDEARFAAERAQNEAAGGNDIWEGVKEFGKNVGSGAGRMIQDPYNLATTLAEQVPSLAVGGVAGRAAVSAAAVERLALKMATKAGTQVTPAIRAAAATSLGAIPERISEGLQEGAGALQQATVEIENTSLEDLAKQYKLVRDQLAEGVDEDTIRNTLIDAVGMRAALTQGVVASTVGGLSSRFDIDPLNTAGRKFLGDAGKEAAEELLQSGGGQLAINEAKVNAGNEQVELLDGVGQAAGQGAALGAGMVGALKGTSVGLQAVPYIPAAIGSAAKGTAKVLGPVLKATGSAAAAAASVATQVAGKAAEGRANKVRAGVDAETKAQETAAVEQATGDLRTALANTGHTLDLGRAGDIAPDELDQLAVLTKIQQDWDNPEMAEGRPTMATYAAHAEAGLNKLLRNVTGELEQENLPEDRRADLLKIQQTAMTLRESPALAAARAEPEKLLADVDIPTLTQQMKDVSYAEMPAETKQAADTVRALISSGRTAGMSSDTIEATRLLYSEDLSEDESRLFEVSGKVAKAQENYQAEVAQRKTIKSVATEMRTGSFQLGKRSLSSIREQMDAVMELSASGMHREAKKVLEHMSWWVNHQGARALDFDAKATAQLERFHADGTWEKQALIGERLDDSGRGIARGTKQTTMLEHAGGQEFGRAIREDAVALADTYNALRELLPEDMRPPEANATFGRKWESLLAGAPVQGGNTQSQVAGEQAPTSNEDTSKTAPKPPESAAPQAPAKTEGQEPGVGAREAEGEAARSEPAEPITPKKSRKKKAKAKAVVEEAPVEPSTTAEDILNEAPIVDFAGPKADDATLTSALELSPEEYLEAVGGNKATDQSVSEALAAELDDREVPARATQVGEVNGITLHADGNYLYAADGDTVVGVLGVSKAGNEFAVAKGYRGRGIGKAMMRELLTRVPMAASGGLSRSARETRLAVLRDLRAEREAQLTMDRSMLNRFPGLKTFRGLKNKFLSAFKTNERSKSIFLRLENPVEEVRAALAQGPEAVRALFADKLDYTGAIDDAAMQSLRYLFGAHVDRMRAALNSGLQARMEELAPKLAGEKGENWWTSADYMGLHLVVAERDADGKQVFRYQPKVLDAMVLGGTRWAMNNLGAPGNFDEERVSKMFPARIIPAALRPYLKGWRNQQAVVSSIAGEITQLLAVSGLSDVTVTTTDGLPKALAGDVLNAFLKMPNLLGAERQAELGGTPAMLERHEINTKDAYGSSRNPLNAKYVAELVEELIKKLGPKMVFVRFPETLADGGMSTLRALGGMLGTNTVIMDALLSANATPRALVGRPARAIRNTVRSTGGLLGKGQEQLLKRLNNIGHAANTPLADAMFKGLSDEVRARLFGKPVYDAANTNAGHLETLKGKEQSARRTEYETRLLLERMQAHATATGKTLEEVRTFWEYEIQSNGRAHQQGFGGQADKWARELFVPDMPPIDFSNAEQVDEYWMALAQAFGIKTTNQDLSLVIAAAQAKIAEGGALAELMEAFRNFDPANPPEDGGEALLSLFEAAKFGHPQRAFNALLTHARFEKADQSQPFKHSLVYEIDGKTDGPINALMQFGLAFFDARVLKQLRQGGLFVGTVDEQTLNDAGGKLGDLYLNGVEHWGNRLRARMANMEPLVQTLIQSNLVALSKVKRARVAEVDLGDGQTELQFEAERDLFKNPLTQKVYGAADATMMIRAAKDILSHYHQMVNQALQENRLLSANEIAEIETGAGFLIQTDRDGTIGAVIKVGIPPLATREDMLAFELGPIHENALRSVMEVGTGQTLADQINDEMSSVDPTMQALYAATAFQAWASHNLYEKLYAARRQELVAAGELNQQEALSRDEEKKLRDQVVHLSPRFHTSQTEGGDGIIINESARDGTLPLLKKSTSGRSTIRTQALLGGFSADINRMTFDPDAGVRIAAQLNIAAGDASMMGGVFGEMVRHWLNVFDGLEAPPGQLKAASEAANKAVWHNWNYDLLGSVIAQFDKFDLDFSKLDKDELYSLGRALRINRNPDFAKGNDAARRVLLEDLLNQQRATLAFLHERTVLVKKVLGELHIAVDHMSGRQRPHTQDGEVLADQDAVMAYIARRIAEAGGTQGAVSPAAVTDQLANIELSKGVPAAPAVDKGAAVKPIARPKDEPVGVVEELTGKQVRDDVLDKHAFKNKVTAFVYSRIRKLIPNDLKIVRGDAEAVLARVRHDHPNADIKSVKQGLYYKGTIYLPVARRADGEVNTDRQFETNMVHELIHAVTYAALDDFYTNGGKRLTMVQKEAVRNLEKLAAHAIKMKVPTDTEAGRVFAKVQGILAGFQGTNDSFSMVAELLSYTLTNRHVQTALKHQKGPEGIRAISKHVLGAIKKFFGLPTNPAIDDFMVQMIGQMERLNVRQLDNSGPLQQLIPLHNQIDDAESVLRTPEHDAHLAQLSTGIDTLLEMLPDDGIYFSPAGMDNHNRYSRGMAIGGGNLAADRMDAAKFYLSGKEKDLFARVHAVITGIRELDSHALIELQRMHTQVMATLEPKHLLEPGETLDDPDTRDVTIPARMAALRDPGRQDMYGRSELLANFVALASVSAPLRAYLASQRMAGDKVDRGSMDSLLRTGTQKIFNLLGARALRNNGKSLEAVLDHMTQRMIQAQEKATTSGHHGLRVMAKAEERVKNALHAGSPLLARGEARVRQWSEQAPNAFLQSAGNVSALVLHLGKSFLDKNLDGDAMSVALNQVLNQAQMPQFFKDIGQEMLGTHSDNSDIHRLLNSAKTRISQIRQRLREHVPALLQRLFKEQLSKQQWKLLHRSIGMTDLQSLLGDFTVAELAEFLRDSGKLDAAIESVRGKLPGTLAQTLAPRAEALGRYMVTKDNENGDMLLNRNAHAMLVTTRKMFGGDVANVTAAEKHLDQLISLYAVKHLSPTELSKTAEIFEKDPDGSKQLLNVMRSMVEMEYKRLGDPTSEKARELRMNMWKGYIPTTADPRKDLVLAGPGQANELLKRGYVQVAGYYGDSTDPTYGMAYYSTKLGGGLATYNQGAMQTVEHSLMGIDSLTGMTLDPAAQTMIKHSDDVWAITDQKWKAAKRRGSFRGQGPQLLPIFDATGAVVAYERPMAANLLKEHTRREGHLAQAVGMWLGRQAEESLADDLNESVIDALHARWELEKVDRAGEYIEINSPRASAVDKATWDALPRTTQARLESTFANGKVMVRSDLKNNALGYRAASVADIFTGTSNLAPETRMALENIAFALAGKRAYPLLVTGERAWQGLIGTAKDIIVVRSGVVAVANLLANQVQLMQMTGWNPARLLRVQLSKAKELEQYMRNQARLTEIVVKLASGVGTAESNQLHLEQRSLEDSNKRLSIEPLLRAGMLPTIAEGLTEQDQYSILGDGMRWIEERAEKLPKGVLTAAKYAVVSKDTALYQGLNRMVQFGDFMAKAVLFEALVEEAKGKPDSNSPEEWQILDEVNQAFVNYNLLPGRGRDYLEGMGVTWFWNYKLRIQKIAIQQIRKNPLRFLSAGVGADWFGLDSLMTSTAPLINWEYSVGPDQLWRSHETLLWRNLMQ